MARPLGAPVESSRPTALIDYAASLRATRELPARLLLPGHGELITDHVTLIDTRLRDHGRRARKLLKLLAAGPLNAHQLAIEMWGPRLALTQTFLTVSEVLGHIDLLLADGSVQESVTPAGVTVFSAV